MNETKKIGSYADVFNKQKKAIIVDEMTINGGEQSSIVTIPLTNSGGSDLTLVLGTPLGSVSEYQNEELYSVITNHFLDNLDNLTADSVKRIINMNERMLRHPYLIGQIEVVTTDDATGVSQRSQKITELFVPANTIDSVRKGGAYVPQNTFITGASLLNKAKTFGEFYGIAYVIKAGATVNFNFYLGGIDTPQFALKS